MLYVHMGIDSQRQFQCVTTTYVTENKEENDLEIYIFQISCPLSLPLLNIPNCQSVLIYLSLYHPYRLEHEISRDVQGLH